MRKLVTGASAAVIAAGLLVLGAPTAALAAGPAASHEGGAAAHDDDRPSSKALKQRALQKKARELQAQGKIPAGAKTAKLGSKAKGQYVELGREGEDSIWTLLVEFGNQTATHNHGAAGVIDHGGAAGPAHNAIPQPDRASDNTTIWAPNFSRDYYKDLLFSGAQGANSMRNYYLEQSSGRYTVNGDVTDWTGVPFNESAYGSDYCGDIVCSRDIQRLLEDGLNAWYANQKAAGKTDAQIDQYLSQFDKWDRYDYDGDGNFDEADGYIDHFQTIHAGVGEETGGGAQGDDAIWSHRGYTNAAGIGTTGPEQNKFGGVHIGGSKYWVFDYTIEPENGGVGVFSHEFGHDLGLPDEYDTSGNTGGAENSTGFWTLMSSGSYGNNGTPAEGIGMRPFHMNAWDKFFLGWLNYEAVRPGDKARPVRLGPAETNTKQAQALITVLPDKKVSTFVGQPASGAKFYYSGTGDDLDTTMSRAFTVPAGATLSAKVLYNIEDDWDYAYLRASTDGGKTWTEVPTSRSTDSNTNSQNFGHGITGLVTEWTPLTADLSAFAGQNVQLQFRYWTDGAQEGNPGVKQTPGFSVDDIAVTGNPVDGAETDAGWAFAPGSTGFHVTTGTDTASYFNAYFAENRQYLGYDAGLKTGPYSLTTADGDFVDHFPYQDGLLVWYYDSSYGNNNVGDHPGEGQILPVDSHPGVLHWSDGSVARGRVQAFDATFGLEPTDPISIRSANGTLSVPRQAAVPVFDDTKSYYVASDPGDALGRYKAGWLSVKTPKTGTKIQVVSTTSGGFMQLQVTPPPAA